MFLFSFSTEKEKTKSTENQNKPLEKMTDVELIECVVNGNTEAFEQIVKNNERFVYSVAFFTTKNSDDAWDVSQEVFLKVYNSVGSFRGDSKFSTWLYRLTKNTACDYARKHYKHRELPISEISNDDDNDRPFDFPDENINSNPEQSLLRGENIRLVRKALSLMDEQQRNILILREIKEKSYDEIAEILELNIGTVKSKLNRARAALKQTLEQKFKDELD